MNISYSRKASAPNSAMTASGLMTLRFDLDIAEVYWITAVPSEVRTHSLPRWTTSSAGTMRSVSSL